MAGGRNKEAYEAYFVDIWGQKFCVNANWAEASSPIYTLDSEGNWVSSGEQVADYRHSARAAMRAQLLAELRASGDSDDPDLLAEIEEAVSGME